MADELAPEDQEVDETRQLKEAVARLGASLREESERLKQDPVADLPIPAAPRTRADPRLDVLAEQLATLVELEQTSAQRADLEAELGRRRDEESRLRDEETKRLANRALIVALIAAAVAVVAVIAAAGSALT